MSSFKYACLTEQDSFRILTLEGGAQDDKLRCRICTQLLASSPNYEALSYVWGDPTRTWPLIANGKELLVTKTLDIALRRLRHTDSERVLWIDQICINQDDLDERAQQVRLMTSIYSKAQQVVFWLGLGDKELIKTAKHLIERLCHPYKTWDEIASPSINQYLVENDLPSIPDGSWDILNYVRDNPYFRRIWAVQECRVAKKILVLFGNQQIDWIDLYHICFWTYLNEGAGLSGYAYKSSSAILFAKGNLACELQKPSKIMTLENLSWLDLLISSWRHEATDRRDKIFALLNVFGASDLKMEPDYRKSVSQVFTDVARKMVYDAKTLDHLSYACLSSTTNLPLWATRWLYVTDGETPLLTYGKRYFNGSKDTVLKPVRSADPRVLRVQGLVLETIVAITATMSVLGRSLIASYFDVWEVIAAEIDRARRAYPHSKSLVLPMLWTLIASTSIFAKTETWNDEQSILSSFIAGIINHLQRDLLQKDLSKTALDLYIQALQAYVHLLSASNSNDPIPQSNARQLFHIRDRMATTKSFMSESDVIALQDLGFTRAEARRYRHYLSFGSQGRKFFISSGGYFGLGSPVVEPGDIICILFGGKTPYVVRPTSEPDEYLFLGECYLHGWMHGEAIELFANGKLETQWFNLR